MLRVMKRLRSALRPSFQSSGRDSNQALQEKRVRSNVKFWQEMHADEYFEKNPCYNGLVDKGDAECGIIEWFVPLKPSMEAVVIGCGYGRESVHISRRVGHVYGIDVSEKILDKARGYTRQNQISNFTGVLVDDYHSKIPNGIDLVFSIAVMQHLTRDLVRDYMQSLGPKLSSSGKMVVQFLEDLNADLEADAELKVYEPSVSWSVPQIALAARASGLQLEQSRSYLETDMALWHWALLGRQAD